MGLLVLYQSYCSAVASIVVGKVRILVCRARALERSQKQARCEAELTPRFLLGFFR
jgi:hypothetical protein